MPRAEVGPPAEATGDGDETGGGMGDARHSILVSSSEGYVPLQGHWCPEHLAGM